MKKVNWGLVLVIAVLCVSLLAPLSSMLENETSNNTAAPEQQQPPKQIIMPVREYIAQLNAAPKEVVPELFITARSNLGDEEYINKTILSFGGVTDIRSQKSATSQTEEELYQYVFDIKLNDSMEADRIDFLVSHYLKELKIIQSSTIAKLDLPEFVNASDKDTGEQKLINLKGKNQDVIAYTYPFTQQGEETSFTLSIAYSGNEVARLIGFENPRMHFLNTRSDKATLQARVSKLTDRLSFSGKIPWDKRQLNATELELALNAVAGVSNASVSIIPPPAALTVNGVNASQLNQTLYNSTGITQTTSSNETNLVIRFNESEITMEALEAKVTASWPDVQLARGIGRIDADAVAKDHKLVEDHLSKYAMDHGTTRQGAVSLPSTLTAEGGRSFTLGEFQEAGATLKPTTQLGDTVDVKVDITSNYDVPISVRAEEI